MVETAENGGRVTQRDLYDSIENLRKEGKEDLKDAVITLRIFMSALEVERDLRYEQRWQAQNKAIETAMVADRAAVAAALVAAEKAVGKADIATEKRFEDGGEKLAAVTSFKDMLGGRSLGTSQGWAYLLVVISVLIAAASLLANILT